MRTNRTPRSSASRRGSAPPEPDGDALGSVLAVVRAAAAIGVRAEGWIVGPFEPNLLSLASPTPLTLVDHKAPTLPADDYDLVVIVDTGAWSQLESLAPWLRPRVDRAIGIDHHARGDLVAAERVIDVACGSASMIVARLVRALGVGFESGGAVEGGARGRGSVAEAIFLGLATDTGWFRFQNARPAEFALASELLASGVDKDRLIEITENSHRPQRLAIEGRALAKVRFIPAAGEGDGASVVAVTSLSMADFAETGATLEETSGVVNMPMAVGAVRAAALLIEAEPGLVKISFRSKPASEGRRFFDVNRIAARFGGGGHVHAAGARIRGTLAEAERAVLEAIR